MPLIVIFDEQLIPRLCISLTMVTVNRQSEQAKTPFGLTIFLSAFLLFWVQLLLGKYILPWFGGTPAVWTTCMLFFQVLLLGGYIYAHVLSSGRMDARTKRYLHCVLLFGSLLFLLGGAWSWDVPLMPGANWKPHTGEQPVWHIISLLSVSIGLPYFMLSSTGPLLQAWYREVHGGESPYRLYALSNLGSFLSLLAFPVLLEPLLRLKWQAWWWSLAYFIFAIGSACCALRSPAKNTPEVPQVANQSRGELGTANVAAPSRPSKGNYLVWVGISTCASITFLATTNQICQDVGVVPMLWILPLGLYLFSFVICFEHEHWYSRGWFHPLFALAILGATFVLSNGATSSLFAQIGIYVFVLFIVCMVCNGELDRSKPDPLYLTSFYLTVAVGGALGGIFVALLAPHIFQGFWEYQVGLWMTTFLLLILLVRDKKSWLYQTGILSPVALLVAAVLLPEIVSLGSGQAIKSTTYISVLVVAFLIVYMLVNRKQSGLSKARQQGTWLISSATLIVLAAVFAVVASAQIRTALHLSRNFYGVLAVREQDMNDPQRDAYFLNHGRILHGLQLRAESERRTPTAYFSQTSGVGQAILRSAAASALDNRQLRVGIVGLGVGTIAAYGRPGDAFRFYEINPEVIRIASDRTYFSFLSDCPANVEVIPGDARLSMESELERSQPQNYDVLAIDAFSGDAIPVHLLTMEAFEIYLKQLRQPSGILAIHVTNGYLDLRPVILAAASHFSLKTAWVRTAGDSRVNREAHWMLLSRDNKILGSADTGNMLGEQSLELPTIARWTDDYGSLLQILKK